MLDAFNKLFSELNRAQIYFIFRINPNDEKLPIK